MLIAEPWWIRNPRMRTKHLRMGSASVHDDENCSSGLNIATIQTISSRRHITCNDESTRSTKGTIADVKASRTGGVSAIGFVMEAWSWWGRERADRRSRSNLRVSSFAVVLSRHGLLVYPVLLIYTVFSRCYVSTRQIYCCKVS